jgi:Asp-tRNA(Asn)/Glu-tRNA(Gln) amidotransferase A subunit family amidase
VDELEWMPAGQLRQRMAARDLSPVELMEALLSRIDRLGPTLNPFITVAADHALEEARAAEQAITRGDPLGALHGIPVRIKDALWEYTDYTMIANVAGYPAASVPAGFVDGLPVGLQLLAPPDHEPLPFRVARALEQAAPWAHLRPPHS